MTKQHGESGCRCGCEDELPALTFETLVDGIWPPALVQTGHNPNTVGKHDVEQGVRKAWDKCATSFAIRDGACEGVLSDEAHDKIK